MPRLKKDGTPFRRPKKYAVKANQRLLEKAKLTGKKTKYYLSSEDARKKLGQFRKRQKRIIKQYHDGMKREERQVLLMAELNGTLDEMHDLMVKVKEQGTHCATQVRLEDGTLIPTHVSPKEDWESKVCERISNGETLRQVSKHTDLPSINRIRKKYRESVEFKRALDQAYTERADHYVDQLYELMEEVKSGTVQPKEASFIADQIRWLAERLHPKFMQKGTGKLNIDLDNTGEGKVQFNIILADNKGKADSKGE